MLFPALAAAPDSSMPPFAGLLVNDSLFFSDVAGRKFGEMDDGELVFAVRRKNTGAIMYSTAPLTQASFEKSGPFWLYPDMELLTGVAGTTLGQLARRRSARNLLFLAFVNIVLLAGVAYRVDNSPVHETRGSGLGLSLVKHAMDAHRGTITVESAPGNGSTFTVRFPIRQAPA